MAPSNEDANPDPAPPTDPAPTAAAPQAGKRWTAPRIGGLVVLVAAFGCTATLWLRPAEDPRLLLQVAACASALLGAWLLAWGGRARWQLPAAIALLVLAALSFSVALIDTGWAMAGAGAGSLGAWAYARRHRALLATWTLLAAGYLVALTAALLQALRGEGEWWLIAQGLGSLGLGGGLLRLNARRSDTETATRALLHRGRNLGRLLLVAGVLLPYIGLALMALGRST